MAIMLTHEIMFIALTDFFALKYRQANKKFKACKSLMVQSSTFGMLNSFAFRVRTFDLFKYLFHSEYMIQRIVAEKPQYRYAA